MPGAGTLWTDALEAEATSRGCTRIRVDASPEAVRFYERRGYQAGVPRTIQVGLASFTFVPMERVA
ncbi:MAG: GNAT family N-acetyltransferase [Myxococcota bacterium]